MQTLFRPRRIAVIGATDKTGKLGRLVMENLLNTEYAGDVYPVNLRHYRVQGHKAYRHVGEIPEQVSLAVIVVPAEVIPQVMRECVAAGIRSAIIISGGFRESGDAGRKIEDEVAQIAREGRVRLVGPNSLGIINPHVGLNASAAQHYPMQGNVAFISQSAAFSTAVLDWSLQENVGFSVFASVGGMIDVDWADLIYYLGDDYRTRSIIVYMETIKDERSFLSAAREIALTKPIIMITPRIGQSARTANQSLSPINRLVDADMVFDAALQRAGVLRVENMTHLFYMAEVLAKQPRPRGKRLLIVTNGSAPGNMAADALVQGGGELAALSDDSIEALSDMMPGFWQADNPIDVMGTATDKLFTSAFEIAGQEKEADALLSILAPQRTIDSTRAAKHLIELAAKTRKPILASWMGGETVLAANDMLNQANIPTFSFPDVAARVFNYMWRYSRNLRALYETPQLPEDSAEDLAAHADVTEMLNEIRGQGRQQLTEREALLVLAAYQLPVIRTPIVENSVDAVTAAIQLGGYPVVVKLNGDRPDVEPALSALFCATNLMSPQAVEAAFRQISLAYSSAIDENPALSPFPGVIVQPFVERGRRLELMMGSSLDAQFGPVIVFGHGGRFAHTSDGHAVGLPPLTSTLARRMVERTFVHQHSDDPVAWEALEALLVRFSQLVVEQPLIREIDINPIQVNEDGFIVLDAAIVLHALDVDLKQVPALAIRPYPREYVAKWQAKNEESVLIRPIRPEDEPKLADFHTHLSDESVYMRYFQMIPLAQRITHNRLIRQVHIDYDREVALVVERLSDSDDAREIIAIGRLSKVRNSDEAEFAVIVRDDMHGMGIGSELLRRLVAAGKREDIGQIVAWTLPENGGMRHIFKRMGFELSYEDGATKAVLPLRLS